MRQLLLLRHAKSSWAEDGLPDRDRPLAERGRRDAALMAEAIAGRDLVPDRVLCSPVHRARQTLAALKPHLSASTEIVLTDDLYGAAGDYRHVIAANGKDAARLMVVGHNPPIQATALALAATGDAALRSRLAAKFPTAALAVIAFRDGDWQAILAGGGRLELFLRPRDLSPDAGDD